jgi:hypothetical protein
VNITRRYLLKLLGLSGVAGAAGAKLLQDAPEPERPHIASMSLPDGGRDWAKQGLIATINKPMVHLRGEGVGGCGFSVEDLVIHYANGISPSDLDLCGRVMHKRDDTWQLQGWATVSDPHLFDRFKDHHEVEVRVDWDDGIAHSGVGRVDAVGPVVPGIDGDVAVQIFITGKSENRLTIQFDRYKV